MRNHLLYSPLSPLLSLLSYLLPSIFSYHLLISILSLLFSSLFFSSPPLLTSLFPPLFSLFSPPLSFFPPLSCLLCSPLPRLFSSFLSLLFSYNQSMNAQKNWHMERLVSSTDRQPDRLIDRNSSNLADKPIDGKIGRLLERRIFFFRPLNG